MSEQVRKNGAMDDEKLKVRVRFFAAPREALGANEITVTLPQGATVEDLIQQLKEMHPVLRAYVRFISVAVNRTYVTMDRELHDGDEVACLPPVGGG